MLRGHLPGYYVPAFCRTPDRSMLRGHLPGDLPLKPSLAYIKYASLLFRGTSPRQLPARWRMLDLDGLIWSNLIY